MRDARATGSLVSHRGRGTFAGMRLLCALAAILAIQLVAAQPALQVAITVDDLPRGGDGGGRSLEDIQSLTARLLKPFRDQRIPVTGFVNEGRAIWLGTDGLRQVLDIWLTTGADLGNHSHSHFDINEVPLEQYTADILRGERALRAALERRGGSLRYYRHPFLRTGPTPEIKSGMQAFLDRHGYRVAPVTIDNADYMYASLYTRAQHRERVRQEYVPYMESVVAFFEERSIEVVGRAIPQVLLIHANELNADLMPHLLAMFRRRGYSFVSLDEALTDAAYRLPDDYAGRRGFSWIHRWSHTKGMTQRTEPDPPRWVLDNWSNP
jgi:peptidoglycan/xylan/chitin deacetylase (PgdA/CDA1 family)